jgi:hypothetical protein
MIQHNQINDKNQETKKKDLIWRKLKDWNLLGSDCLQNSILSQKTLIVSRI